MAWSLDADVAPADCTVKDDPNEVCTAGISGTTFQQDYELQLDKSAVDPGKCRIDPDTGMCIAQFSYEAFWNDVKREFGSQLDNCFIEDDTFGETIAGPFSLTLGGSAGPFFADFPIDSKVTNLATLTCTDQFDNEQTSGRIK